MKYKNLKLLYTFIAELNDPKMVESLLLDILSQSELDGLEKRLEIIRLLKSNIPQREIAKQLDIGIATVTRGSKLIKSQKSESWWTDLLWRK